jgi:hypothetical protein
MTVVGRKEQEEEGVAAAQKDGSASGQATPTGRLHPQATSAIEGGMT